MDKYCELRSRRAVTDDDGVGRYKTSSEQGAGSLNNGQTHLL